MVLSASRWPAPWRKGRLHARTRRSRCRSPASPARLAGARRSPSASSISGLLAGDARPSIWSAATAISAEASSAWRRSRTRSVSWKRQLAELGPDRALPAVDFVGPLLEGLDEGPEGLVEDRAHQETEGKTLEFVGDEELDLAPRAQRLQGPAVLQIAERPVHIFDKDTQPRAVERDAAREGLVDLLVPDLHLGNERLDALAALRSAPHLKPFAERQEVRIFFYIRDQIEHFLRRVPDLPRGAKRRHADGSAPELGGARAPQLREIVAGVMRRARQRRRGYEEKALGVGCGLIGFELVRRHETDHRMVLASRLQILAHGKEIDLGRAQVVHELEHLVPLLAEANHNAGLGEHGGIELLHPLEEPHGVEVAGARPHGQVFRRHRLEIVVEDVGLRFSHNLQGSVLPQEIGR